MLSAVTFAKDEGKRLGLRIDVTLCSGWPYGGPATSLAEAAGRLKVVEVAVAADATRVDLPKVDAGDQLISASIAPGEPKHWTATSAQDLPLSIPMDVHWIVTESATEARVALLFYSSHTKQQVKRAALGAEGYVLDPFSRVAVATHLKAVGEPLVKAFGAAPPYAIFSDSLEAYGADWTPKLVEEFPEAARI